MSTYPMDTELFDEYSPDAINSDDINETLSEIKSFDGYFKNNNTTFQNIGTDLINISDLQEKYDEEEEELINKLENKEITKKVYNEKHSKLEKGIAHEIKKAIANNNKFSDSFYEKINGSIIFKNVYTPKQKKHKAIIKFNMANIETEILIYLLLSNSPTINLNKIPASILIVYNNYKNTPFFGLFIDAFLNQIKFINSTKQTEQIITKVQEIVKTGKAGRPKKILVDKIKEKVIGVTPKGWKRILKPDTKAYKKYYGDIKLFSAYPKDLTNFDIVQNNYEHCVLGWIKENFNKKDYETHKHKNDWTANDLLKLSQDYNFSMTLKDRTGGIIEEYEHDKTKKNTIKKLNGIISNEHLYIERKQRKEPMKEIIVTEDENILNTIETSTYTHFIINEILFKKIKEHISKDKIMNEYNDYGLKYKTNKISLLNDNYLEQKQIMIDAEKDKIKSFNNYIDSICKLRGYLSNEVYEIFNNIHKIRYYKTESNFNIQFDANKAYPSKLLNEKNIFGVPSLNDEFVLYDDSAIETFYWYEIELNNYDLILGTADGIYSGDAVIILKNDKRVKKINKVLKVSNFIRIEKDSLKNIDYLYLTMYIGWLRNIENVDTKFYDEVTNENEINALFNKYGDEIQYNEYATRITITKQYKKMATGILVNSQIVEMNNIELYKLNKEYLKLNPDSYITHIKTDSIGYLSKNNIKIPKMVKTKDDVGFFKIEKDNRHLKYNYIKPENNNTIYKYRKMVLHHKDINNLDEDDYKEHLDNNLSFGLFGAGGYGKTYYIKNVIVPYLEKTNKKYILASTTIENAKDIDGITIQSIFSEKSEFEIKNYFDEISYLIIDEASQLTQQLYKRLEQIKLYGVNLILIGDECQTHGIDTNTSLLRTNFTHNLLDYNIISKKYDERYCRYDKELNKHLQYIRNNFNDLNLIKKYVYKSFKTTKEVNTEINIAYFHKTCDINKNCHTVHSYQGKTINEKYTIFNICQMSPYIIYTALSRSIKYDNIFIFSN